MRPLTRNERLLAGALGALVFLFINLAGMRWVASQMSTEGARIRQLEAEAVAARQLLKQRPYWIARQEWMAAHPPAAYDERITRSKFVQDVQSGLQAAGVKIESNLPLETDRAGNLAIVNIDLEVNGRFEAIIRWLHAAQQPGQYASLGNFTLKQGEDGNSMELQVRLGKIYRADAPATVP